MNLKPTAHKVFTAHNEFYGHLVAWPQHDGSFRLTWQDLSSNRKDETVLDQQVDIENFYNTSARVILND